MKGLNRVYITGAIGQDPEMRTTSNGKSILRVSVCSSHHVKDGDGWKEVPDWHKITIFGKDAEYVNKYGMKGGKISIEGHLSYGRWTDDKGIEHFETNIVAERIIDLAAKVVREETGGRSQQSENRGGYGSRSSHTPDPNNDGAPPFGGDDDIPF